MKDNDSISLRTDMEVPRNITEVIVQSVCLNQGLKAEAEAEGA